MSSVLYACSSNPGKLREFSLAAREFASSAFQVETLPRLKEVPAPEEIGQTFEENARSKAEYYSRFTSELVFADDSGLEVQALEGAPGIYSARFAGPDATDAENNQLLLLRLGASRKRDARFVCVIALARAGRSLGTFQASVEGQILESERGENGFGYDPLFFYPPFGRSFAEITPDEKFRISHRGTALRKLFEYLRNSTVQR